MIELDEIDRKILNILLKDARTSYSQIARQCGLSGAAIHQRIAKLKMNHVFRTSQIQLSPKGIGYTTCAFIGIQVNLINEKTHEEVFNKIKDIPEITECHHITGKYSLMAKIYTKNNEDLKRILVEEIQSIVEVVGTETFISLEEGFSRQLPLG
jgi:Lrp/AsnC family transcriptional regulator for asnA, asnC and gidA